MKYLPLAVFLLWKLHQRSAWKCLEASIHCICKCSHCSVACTPCTVSAVSAESRSDYRQA